MTASTRRADSGVILINVLVALALGSALVVLMLTSQDNLVDRARRTSAAAQAEALARGAEAAAIVALRRDMIEAPATDHYQEPWAQSRQDVVTLATGKFAVRITDAQSRFDINGLAGRSVVPAQILARLIAALELPPAVGAQIAAQVARDGPARSLADFDFLDAAARDRLAPYVGFLPTPGTVNLNTAPAELLQVMLQNRTAAARLVAIRDRAGYLTPADLTAVGSVSAPGTGFTSDVYDIAVTAEVDGMTVALESRLVRQRGTGTIDVIVASRRFGEPASTSGAE